MSTSLKSVAAAKGQIRLSIYVNAFQEDKMATLRAIRNNEPTTDASAARVEMKLEVVVIPVSDVDRAKEFYARLGW
jgi:hypothetical protein